MIAKMLNLFLFWRRNHLPSIIFKSLFWGVLAWLAVGIFSSLQTALIGGLAASILAACKYSLKYFKRRKQLLAKVGGDKEKLKNLQKATSKGGLGGALINEMLTAELEDDDDYDESNNEEEEELTEEQKAQNKARTEHLCKELSKAITIGKYASEDHCTSATLAVMEEYGDGSDSPDPRELIGEFLPQCLLSFDSEDYCNQDDHAGLVDMFAESTLGKWSPGETSSNYDEESGKWLVHFFENGDRKTWRFNQHADHLNGKFVDQLVQYTRSRSGNIIQCSDAEDDYIEMTSLPADIHQLLFKDAQDLAA